MMEHKVLLSLYLQRDAATAPNVGDRVPYVIIKAAKGAKVIFLWPFYFLVNFAWKIERVMYSASTGLWEVRGSYLCARK